MIIQYQSPQKALCNDSDLPCCDVCWYVHYHHSTTTLPRICLCPDPHGTEQNISNVPTLSAVNSTVLLSPGAIFALTPKSGIANPCSVSSEGTETVNFTRSPWRRRMLPGANSNFFAITEISRTVTGSGVASGIGCASASMTLTET